MCWSCNPYCGGCKPPKEKPVKCGVCGHYTFFELIYCKKCGAALPPPPARPIVLCLYIGAECANPCNKHKKPSQDGQEKMCKWHTLPNNEPDEKPRE